MREDGIRRLIRSKNILKTLSTLLFVGMLENFAALIKAYGMIPNGNRVYYTRRSQPPLFIAMVDEYYKVRMENFQWTFRDIKLMIIY